MSIGRKALIILAVVVIAMGVFGFKNKEHFNYDQGHKGPGPNLPKHCIAMEYTASHSDNIYNSWDNQQRIRQIQDHLNYMGSQGWELISVDKSMGDQYTFFFMRPSGR